MPRHLKFSVAAAAALLLSACCTELRRGKEEYNEGMVLLNREPDRARDHLKQAKQLLIDAVQGCGLKKEQKIQPLTLIARIYMEEDNLKMAEEYLRKAIENIEPDKPYKDSDVAMLALVKGEFYMREAQTALLNISEKDRRFGEKLRDQALRYMDEALTEYFVGSGRTQNATINRMLDLRKVHTYMEMSKVYQLHTKGTRKESIEESRKALKTALKIAEENIGKQYLFQRDFEDYRDKIKDELKRVEKELGQ